MKKCIDCKKVKKINDFYKKKSSKDGYFNSCKDCSNTKVKKLKRTKKGLINVLYSTQKQSSKKRGHNPPNYTIDKLYDWILSQPNFDKLYNDWVNSKYKTQLRPSIDRINDYKGYSLGNIQLMTWKENKQKHINQLLTYQKTFNSKKVIQIFKNGRNVIFNSAKEAERKTKIPNSNIISVCKGKRKTAGGYIWAYYELQA